MWDPGGKVKAKNSKKIRKIPKKFREIHILNSRVFHGKSEPARSAGQGMKPQLDGVHADHGELERGYNGMGVLLSRSPRLDAVFCINDILAAGAVRFLKLLPAYHDLLIIGGMTTICRNCIWPTISPPLRSMLSRCHRPRYIGC